MTPPPFPVFQKIQSLYIIFWKSWAVWHNPLPPSPRLSTPLFQGRDRPDKGGPARRPLLLAAEDGGALRGGGRGGPRPGRASHRQLLKAPPGLNFIRWKNHEKHQYPLVSKLKIITQDAKKSKCLT